MTDLAQYAQDFGAFINSPCRPCRPTPSPPPVADPRADAQGRGRRPEGRQRGRGLHRPAGGGRPHDDVASGLTGAIAKQLPRQGRRRPGQQGRRTRHHPQRRPAGARVPGRRPPPAPPSAAAPTSSPAPPQPSTPTPTPSPPPSAASTAPEAGKAFAPLWKKHIDFLVDYTTARGRPRTRPRPTRRWGPPRLHGGLRRLHQHRVAEAAQGGRGRTGQDPRPHAEGRDRRPGGQGLLARPTPASGPPPTTWP